MTKAKFVYIQSDLIKTVDDAEDQLERHAETVFNMVARDVIEWSKYGEQGKGGVDTGAYITSFSFTVGQGRPRGKSSHGRPRKQSAERMGAIGLAQLQSDLANVDFLNTTSIILRNNSPHASYVENHSLVMSKVKVKYGNGR